MNKTFDIGKLGSASLVEAGGKFTFTLTINQQCGGGNLTGFLTVKEQLVVEGSGLQVVDGGLILAESKWPTFATEIAGAKVLIDAFIATL